METVAHLIKIYDVHWEIVSHLLEITHTNMYAKLQSNVLVYRN